MIKKTLFFANPAYLSTKNEQLHISFPDTNQPARTVPIEDIGLVVLEHPQITLTHAALSKLTEHKVCLVTCNSQHLPEGMMLPLQGHSSQTERIRIQLEASLPLKKNLWQQTVIAKIENQAALLEERGKDATRLTYLASKVRSGDPQNCEAQAAAIYWQRLFDLPHFTRQQTGLAPNNLLNYGYAILRAVIARALVSSGMLPGVGIWHHNKYNAYCLADDLMEPYRPYVDRLVGDMVQAGESMDELSPDLKRLLLGIPTLDVRLAGQQSPLMVAASRTSNSLYACFEGSSRKILFPTYGA